MPRRSNWKSSETKAIRVPAELADQLLALAHAMENQNRFVQNEPMDNVMISIATPSGEVDHKIVSAPASVWRQADEMARDILASPAIANLSESQRLQFALLLAEQI